MTMPLQLEDYAYPAQAVPAAPAVAATRVNVFIRVSMLFFVLSIPFEMPHRTVIPFEIPTFFLIIFLFATLTSPRTCYRIVPTPLLFFMLYVWVLAISAVVNGVVGDNMDSVIKHFVTFALLLAFLWAMTNVLADARALRLAVIGYTLAITIRAIMQILGIGAHRITVWTGGDRVTILGQNTNWSAIILAAGLCLVVGLFVAPGKWLPKIPFLTWPLAAILGYAVIQTGSRGGLLCITAGMIVFLFSGRTPAVRLRNALIGVAGIAVLAFAALNIPMMRNRLMQSANEGNFAGRERIYPAVVSMIVDKPIIGFGPIENQFEIGKRINERRKVSRDAHNIVGELMTTAGLLGAVPFLIGIGLCFRSAFRARRGALGYLPLALLCTVGMGCLSGTWLVSKILWLTLSVALAAGARWAAPMTTRIWSVEPHAAAS